MIGQEIIANLRAQVKERILENDYEKLEILANFRIRNGELSHTDEKTIFTKNGKREEKSFGYDYREYKQLVSFFKGERINELYIVGTKEEVMIYGNEAIEECDIPLIPIYKNPKHFIQERLNPHLEEGLDYISVVEVHPKNGASASLFYAYKDGVKSSDVIESIYLYDETEIELLMSINALAKDFTKGSKTKIIARKNKSLEIFECSAKDLIADIKPFYSFVDGGYEEIYYDVLYSAADYDWQIVNINVDGYILQNGKKQEVKHYPVTDFEYLYLFLNKSIDKLTIHITKEETKVYAVRAFPEYGIEQREETLVVQPEDLTTICQFIESGREDKMSIAIEAIVSNEQTKTRLEKRYLNFVKAYLENDAATLNDMQAEMFSEKTKNICIGHRPSIDKDYISFGYSNEKEAKLIIDFIGAMVKNYIDIDVYIKEHNEAYNTNWDLAMKTALYDQWEHELREGIEREITLHPEGWYSKSYEKLMHLKLSKVMVDNAHFYKEDRMPLLKEYLLYLSIAAGNQALYIDVYDSYMHELTTVYWMFRVLPRINWFQSNPTYTPCPYTPKREAEMRVDNGLWSIVE